MRSHRKKIAFSLIPIIFVIGTIQPGDCLPFSQIQKLIINAAKNVPKVTNRFKPISPIITKSNILKNQLLHEQLLKHGFCIPNCDEILRTINNFEIDNSNVVISKGFIAVKLKNLMQPVKPIQKLSSGHIIFVNSKITKYHDYVKIEKENVLVIAQYNSPELSPTVNFTDSELSVIFKDLYNPTITPLRKKKWEKVAEEAVRNARKNKPKINTDELYRIASEAAEKAAQEDLIKESKRTRYSGVFLEKVAFHLTIQTIASAALQKGLGENEDCKKNKNCKNP